MDFLLLCPLLPCQVEKVLLWCRRPLLPFKYQHLGDMMSLGKAAPPSVEGCRHHAAACCMILAAAVAAGRTSGAVTLPVSVSEGVASSLQSGPLGSLLGAAGIR